VCVRACVRACTCTVLPIYKGKADPMECGSYRGIKLLESGGSIFEHRIQHQIDIDDM